MFLQNYHKQVSCDKKKSVCLQILARQCYIKILVCGQLPYNNKFNSLNGQVEQFNCKEIFVSSSYELENHYKQVL